MFGEFQKLQKICNKMSTRIFKIDGEMPEIIEPKVGNPQNSTNQNLANLSQPWNLTFLKDEIFKLFFQSYVPKVPEWKITHIEWSKKVQNIRKSPKNEVFRGTYLIPTFWEHPVDRRITLTASASAAAIAGLHDVRHLGHDGVVAVVADVGRDPHPLTPPVILADQVNLDTLHISSNIFRYSIITEVQLSSATTVSTSTSTG